MNKISYPVISFRIWSVDIFNFNTVGNLFLVSVVTVILWHMETPTGYIKAVAWKREQVKISA